jgi:hypothetical protein
MTIEYRKMVQRRHLVQQSEHNHKKYSLCLQTKYFTVSSHDMCVLYNTLLFSVAATHPIGLYSSASSLKNRFILLIDLLQAPF